MFKTIAILSLFSGGLGYGLYIGFDNCSTCERHCPFAGKSCCSSASTAELSCCATACPACVPACEDCCDDCETCCLPSDAVAIANSSQKASAKVAVAASNSASATSCADCCDVCGGCRDCELNCADCCEPTAHKAILPAAQK